MFRLISMYNGSDSNSSAHTRFAKPVETRRTSYYPGTHSIIQYISHMVREAMELEFDCLKQGERTTNVLLESEIPSENYA